MLAELIASRESRKERTRAHPLGDMRGPSGSPARARQGRLGDDHPVVLSELGGRLLRWRRRRRWRNCDAAWCSPGATTQDPLFEARVWAGRGPSVNRFLRMPPGPSGPWWRPTCLAARRDRGTRRARKEVANPLFDQTTAPERNQDPSWASTARGLLLAERKSACRSAVSRGQGTPIQLARDMRASRGIPTRLGVASGDSYPF